MDFTGRFFTVSLLPDAVLARNYPVAGDRDPANCLDNDLALTLSGI